MSLPKVFDFEAELIESTDYASEGTVVVKIVKLSTKNAPGFDFNPGQFVMIYTDEVKNPVDQSRPKMSSMSICNAPHQKGFVELCLRMHDKPGPSVSRYIRDNMKIGDKIKVKGPFGAFNLNEGTKNVAFVGTGTGIAPLMSMFRHLVYTKFGGKIVFFYGCRNDAEFLYKKELLETAKKMPNLDLQVIFSREEKNGKKGYIQELIKAYKFPAKDFEFYMCGNPRAVQEEKQALESLGFAKEQMHEEKW